MAISSDMMEECSHETQSCIKLQDEVSTEVDNLVQTTLASIAGGGVITSTMESLMSEYATVKESRSLNKQQMSEVRSHMEQKIKERKETLVSKQQKKRLKVGPL